MQAGMLNTTDKSSFLGEVVNLHMHHDELCTDVGPPIELLKQGKTAEFCGGAVPPSLSSSP